MKLKKLLSLLLVCILMISSLSVLTAQASDYQLGDADKSAIVNIKDATLIQKAVAFIVELSDEQVKLADVDASGDITIKDATAIQKWIVGIPVEFPIGGVEPEPAPWSDADIARMGEDIRYEAKGKTINMRIWVPEHTINTFSSQTRSFERMFSEYANINISIEPMETYDSAAMLLNDPGSAADVLMFPSDLLDKLIRAEYILESPFKEEVRLANTSASFNAACEGKNLYAYPINGDNTFILAYNKKYVSDTQAQSWETLMSACKAAGKNCVMAANNGYFASTFLFTGGLRLEGLESDELTQKFNDYDIDSVTASVQAFGKLFRDAGYTYNNAESYVAVDGFYNNSVAAGVIGSWEVSAVCEALGNNAGFAKLPTININGTAKPSIGMCGYMFLGVNYRSSYPDTAQILSYYLSNEECQYERAVQLNWTPTNKNAINSDVVAGNDSAQAIVAQSNYSVAQRGIAATFWDPSAALGMYITDSRSDLSTADVKFEVELCIRNILDY